MEIGESCETAARREALEETNLKLDRLYFVGVYSEPDRDPRKHIISIAYLADVTGQTPVAGDDAREIVRLSLPDIVSSIRGQMYEIVGVTKDGVEIHAPAPTPPKFDWCFDHALILKDAHRRYEYRF